MKGVVFFLEATGKPAHLRHLAAGWCMLDMQKHCIEKARSPIREDEALVVIGDAQCRCDCAHWPACRAHSCCSLLSESESERSATCLQMCTMASSYLHRSADGH